MTKEQIEQEFTKENLRKEGILRVFEAVRKELLAVEANIKTINEQYKKVMEEENEKEDTKKKKDD